MNDTIGTILAVIVALATVIGVYFTARSSARTRAAEDESKEKQIRDEAFAAGVKSRDDEVRQLSGQLGDARYQRDRETARADNAERDLRDRRAR